jgi:hypothetical protein
MAKNKNNQQDIEQMATKETKTSMSQGSDNMLFHKENYIYMAIGLVFIFLGFTLMAGGKSADPNVFASDEIYSFRRITLAPILVLIGFAIEGFAILKSPKQA